jgi:hypothetical protein
MNFKPISAWILLSPILAYLILIAALCEVAGWSGPWRLTVRIIDWIMSLGEGDPA